MILVARLVAVTVAAGTTAPLESVTIPVMLANVVWEYNAPEKIRREATP